MNIVKVYLNESRAYFSFYPSSDKNDTVRQVKELMEQGAYRCIGTFETDKENERAAEDMFDLSNNPDRDEERSFRWGSNRSLSVGDIVQVNDDRWLCASVGWQKI